MATPPHTDRSALLPTNAAKLVLSDLDGTLLPDRGTDVPRPEREAVARLRARGVWFVPTTGRSVAGTVPLCHQLGLGRGEYFIASNGAVTGQLTGMRRRPFTILSQRTFDPAGAFLVAMTLDPNARMAIELPEDGAWLVNRTFPDGMLNGLQRRVRDPKRLYAEEVTRAAVHAPGIANFLRNIAGTGVTAYPHGPDWIDITGPTKPTSSDSASRSTPTTSPPSATAPTTSHS